MKANDVIVFTQEGCPNCESLKKLLDKKFIKYETSTNYEEIRGKFDTLPVVKEGDEYYTFKDYVRRLS